MPIRRRILAALVAVVATAASVAVAERVLKWREEVLVREGDYRSAWRSGGLGPGGFLREGFSAHVIGGDGERVRWHNNSQGLRYDHELATIPDPAVPRILVIGDSFAAGFRTDQHATFSHLAESALRSTGIAVEMPIAVIEEPVTGLFWLQEHGLRFRPNVVLLTLCLGNDIAQTFVALHERGGFALDPAAEPPIRRCTPAEPVGFRHGLEQFELPANALVADPPRERRTPFRLRLLTPVFGEPRYPIRGWYGRHEPHRLFDAINGLGVQLRDPPPEVATAYARLGQTLGVYQQLCQSTGVRFAVLLAPQRYQVQPVDWDLAVKSYGLVPAAFDLERCNRVIAAQCSEHGIPCIDPTEAMRRAYASTGEELYLPRGDMHWSAAGNRVVADVLAPALRAMLATK